MTGQPSPGQPAGGQPAGGQPAVSHLRTARTVTLASGVTQVLLLDDRHGCRRLHQRRLRMAPGAAFGGTCDGFGESWYVISGTGALAADVTASAEGTFQAGVTGPAKGTLPAGVTGPGEGTIPLRPGIAVWLRSGTRFRCDAAESLEIVSIRVRCGSPDDDTGPAIRVAALEDRTPERTGDREFRVLLTADRTGQLAITEFAGLIPPGRAPVHQHTYDEVVHVLSGYGIVHLTGEKAPMGTGTSVYLPPGTPHCLENTGTEPLQVLGVFYPAGSPATKHE
jgi:mannose-6-phosphate isomerase-like protein (cupin superfamily)